MQPEFKSTPKAHVIRVVVTLIALMVVGTGLRQIFLPDEFGKHGHYRPGAVEDEANRLARNMSNESCLDCHRYIKNLHFESTHKDVACETCHGAFADHVQDDAAYATMPVIRGEDIQPLCLRCHQQIVQAMPPESIKLMALPEHLEKKKVRLTHDCNQCHHVHAPLKWVYESREFMGLPRVKEES